MVILNVQTMFNMYMKNHKYVFLSDNGDEKTRRGLPASSTGGGLAVFGFKYHPFYLFDISSFLNIYVFK